MLTHSVWLRVVSWFLARVFKMKAIHACDKINEEVDAYTLRLPGWRPDKICNPTVTYSKNCLLYRSFFERKKMYEIKTGDQESDASTLLWIWSHPTSHPLNKQVGLH